MTYNLANLKSRLTRAKRSGDYNRVLQEVQDAYETFEREGYPDCWQDWERAAMDARFATGRAFQAGAIHA